jgi:type VI secretion system secreted protein VgrG
VGESTTDVFMRFESDAPELAEAPNVVVRVSIEERLSTLYAVEVHLEVQQDLPLSRDEVASVLRSPARLRLSAGSVDRITHGVLRELELLGPTPTGKIAYRAVIVPRLARLAHVHRSRVFQGMSYPGIVRRVLLDAELVEGRDFELRLRRGPCAEPDDLPEPGAPNDDFADYPQREYTVQLEESDLVFVERLLEHEGIGFAYEQGDERERLVLFDDPSQLADLGAIPFTTQRAHDLTGHVTRIARRHRTVTGRAVVRDYNWRTPQVPVAGERVADEAFGEGFAAYYGAHAKTPKDAERYARIAAERLAVDREVYAGEASTTDLAAGVRFAIEHAYCGDLDQPYFVIATSIRAAAPDDGALPGYTLSFEAIAADTPWRPPVRHGWPRIAGLMHARVDGVQIGKAAPIDEHGRYKVLLPWDLYGQPGGRASRWIRMAQPHAGDGYGMHFPLHIGTEVLLAHVGGDPDRPVIVGSVPNPDTRSPVTRENATHNVLRTRTGILVELDDDPR